MIIKFGLGGKILKERSLPESTPGRCGLTCCWDGNRLWLEQSHYPNGIKGGVKTEQLGEIRDSDLDDYRWDYNHRNIDPPNTGFRPDTWIDDGGKKDFYPHPAPHWAWEMYRGLIERKK